MKVYEQSSGMMFASAPKAGNAQAFSAPIRLPRKGPVILGPLVLAIASIWLAVVFRGLANGDPAIVPGLGPSGTHWAAALGAALALLGLYWTVRRDTLALGNDALVVTRWSLLGRKRWREPLANYREIRGRVEESAHRYGKRRWYVAELWHPDAARRIELTRDRDRGAVEELARDCARRFGLAVVWIQPPSDARSVPFDAQPVPDHAVPEGAPGDMAETALSGRSFSAG